MCGGCLSRALVVARRQAEVVGHWAERIAQDPAHRSRAWPAGELASPRHSRSRAGWLLHWPAIRGSWTNSRGPVTLARRRGGSGGCRGIGRSLRPKRYGAPARSGDQRLLRRHEARGALRFDDLTSGDLGESVALENENAKGLGAKGELFVRWLPHCPRVPALCDPQPLHSITASDTGSTHRETSPPNPRVTRSPPSKCSAITGPL